MIRESGLLRRRYGYYWAKLIGFPLLLIAVVAAFILIGDTWWQLLTAGVFAVIFTQIAFLGHDAAHRQIFASGKWNDWTSLILANLLGGMSVGWWQSKHTRHHANPNKVGSDPDIDLPVFRMVPSVEADEATSNVAQQPEGDPTPARRPSWFRRNQGIFFIPILFLEGLSLHYSGIRRVLTRQKLTRRWVEITFLTVRLGGFVALVFWVLSPGIAFAFLGVQLGLFGFYMGMSFAPNHMAMPLVPRNAKLSFLRRQAMMSRNIRGSRFLDTAMGGLNFQIEHHLFPSMPRPHLRKASVMIAEYCRNHDVPYLETNLRSAYASIIRYLNRVGLGNRDVFVCPLVEQRRHIGATGS